VAVDNDGGGIFHFLPHADPHLVTAERFEEVFATPHGLDLTAIAAAYGLRAGDVASLEDLQDAVAKPPTVPQLVRIRTNRAENVAVHQRIRAAVRRHLAI
jgi:2-succinyl-5-enolpyruvyl-6-hydroxy-3-cyclohexene-1-carboxylate synthase